jgi:hypothetical protein
MIQKASEMEDGSMKAGFINLIGSFMKQACKNWNEEQLSDEEILSHLEMLSEGRIRMTSDEDVQFNALQNQQNRNRSFRNDRSDRNGGGNGQNRNRNQNQNRNRNNGNGQNRNGGGNGQNRNFRPNKNR